ncbi:hypothetical protein [Methanoculleus chikugoensis]|uniref:hypothetical protein n=1 Tax=Methanoculleus chikugoensis TaxID=118126 RepID=UPI001FB519A0|nr:hypothetical protein [Methanoculleus chikugoensis]
MVTVVVIYSFVIPLTNVFVVLGGAVALGGLVYLLVLLKTDRGGIRDELKELIMGLGIPPWPGVL